MDVPPNQTLYISNLYGKLKKGETRECMYALFGQFGKILDVVCMGNARLKGQAWVVFADISSATSALRAMQDFPFGDGRPMRVHYARSKSDVVGKLEGNWKKGRESRTAQITPTAADNKGTPAAVVDVGEVNTRLFIDHLPEATTDAMLTVLFKQFPGFKEARTVPGRPGIAFVEFESDLQASVALSGLQGFKITPENAMQIVYAKQ